MGAKRPRKAATLLPVAERALLARINRKLEKDGDGVMRRCPEGSRWFNDLGRYYITNDDIIVAHHIEIEQWARDAGVLKPYEKLED
jgi:hypothetical protein